MDKKNETLEQQRKARKEFLELKKMQSGEISTGPKPSEVEVLPKTFTEKIANFWYHYKFAAIFIVLSAAVLAVLITQCATRTKYDLTAVIYSNEFVDENYNTAIGNYLAKYINDINGDGKVNIQVVNCTYEASKTASQYEMTVSQKFQTMLVAEDSAMIFITNDGIKEKLAKINSDIFNLEEIRLGNSFYNAVSNEKLYKLPNDLSLNIKAVTDKKLKDEKIKKCVDEAQKIYDGVKKDNG